MNEKYYIEEACRQWCEFIDEAPERKNGIGFYEFYLEVKAHLQKEAEEQKATKAVKACKILTHYGRFGERRLK